MKYVTSETGKNPKGYPTLEKTALKKNPNFVNEITIVKTPEVTIKMAETFEITPEITPATTPVFVGSQESLFETPVKTEENISVDLSNIHIYPESEVLVDSYSRYDFDKFNPIQSRTLEICKEDKNLVICTSTGSGKTISAEILMDDALETGSVVYTAPLKALAEEKFVEWNKTYPEKDILIITGDHNLTTSKLTLMNQADIIIMTTEMLHSRISNLKNSHTWINKCTLLINDEAHLITDSSRGAVVEVAIMGFTKINKKARLVSLSATLPGNDKLGAWLGALNNKETNIIQSNWRPVELQVMFPIYREVKYSSERIDYWKTEDNKQALAMDIIQKYFNEKFIVFCHSKAMGRKMVKKIRSLGVACEFHNADKNKIERQDIEEDFKNPNGNVRILVATSTLSQGLNTPAENVIVMGWHRGINDVEPYEVIQEAGRAGRIGYCDGIGKAFILTPDTSFQSYVNSFYNAGDIKSQLAASKHTLAFQILCEIKNGSTNIDSIIKEDHNGLVSTRLGDVAIKMYYSPFDIFQMFKNGWRASNAGFTDEEVCLMFGDIPSEQRDYLLQEEKEIYQNLVSTLNVDSLPGHIMVAAWLALEGSKTSGSLTANVRNFRFDIERKITAIKLIDANIARWNQKSLWETLELRFKYGIPEEIIELVKIPGVGGATAKKLYKNGICNLEDLRNETRPLHNLVAPQFANKIKQFLNQ